MHGKHGNFMQMAAPIGFGEILGFPMMSYAHVCTCVCVHTRACAHGWGALSHHPHPHPPTLPPPRGTLGIIQNSIALELIEIFQFCLKI